MHLRLAFVVVAALLRLQEGDVAVPAKVLEEYAGSYKVRQFSLVVTVEDDRLMGEAPGIPKFPLPARSQTKFFVPPASAEIEFVRGDDGAVTHFVLRQNGSQQVVQRVKEFAKLSLMNQSTTYR